MARIKTYSTDNVLTDRDRLLGTDSAGGINSTNNFTLGDLKDFIGLGIDLTKRTPRFNIPSINAASNDVEPSNIIKTVVPQQDNIEFYLVAPTDALPANTQRNTLQSEFYIIADSSNPDGFVFAATNYRAKYDINSFAGKNFSAIVSVSGTNVTVTGTLGTLRETTDNFYEVNSSNGEVTYSFNITRTSPVTLGDGDPDFRTNWALLNEANTTIQQLTFTRASNPGDAGTLSLVTIRVEGDAHLEDVTIAGELDIARIPFDAHNDGIIYQEAGQTAGVVSLLMRDDLTTFEKQALGRGEATHGFLSIESRALSTDTKTNTPFLINTDAYSFEDIRLVTPNNIQTNDSDVAMNTSRDQTSVVISYNGITSTYSDGSDAGRFTRVSANNHTTYRRPAGDTRVQGPLLGGVLTEIQIDDEYFTVPTSISQVAQTLPGLYEELSSIPNGTTMPFPRTDVGRRNDSSITSGSLALNTWGAGGDFAFYTAASSETITINAAGNLVYSAGSTLAPNTTAATVTLSNYLVVIDNRLRSVAIGDEVRVYDNTAGSSSYWTMTVTSVDQRVLTSSDRLNQVAMLIGFSATPAINSGGTVFAIGTGDYDLEVLRTNSGALTTGTFFYGIDQGTYAEFRTALASQPAAITLTRGTTSVTFNQDTNLNNGNDAIPSGQRLFFVENTNNITGLSSGNTVPGNVYEVVSYIHNTGVSVGSDVQARLTYSLIGNGNLVISSPTITISNLSESTSVNPQFLTRNTDGELEGTIITDIAGADAVASYADTISTGNTGTLQRISFTTTALAGEDGGDHNISAAGGVVTVDVTGRIPVHATPLTAGDTLATWNQYMLNHPTVATDRTLTLPASPEVGDTIVIHNLSNLTAAGAETTPTIDWLLVPQTGARIMRDSGTTTLDVYSSFELVWSGVAAIGWLIK